MAAQHGVRRSIDILAPPRATLGPYGAHRTPLEPVPRAKANGPFQRARACCGPPQSARPASRELWRTGARGAARGEATYLTPTPHRSCAPPTARASTYERIFASSSQPIPKYATLRELSACGRRYPRRPGRVEPRFVAPGHPTVINRCPAKICPISRCQSVASTRGVARLRAGACIEVRGRSAPGARVAGAGRARFAARRVSQGTNTRPRPPAPPRGPNSHPPPRRATHGQRAHAD